MKRWKVMIIVSILALLVFTLFLSNKIVYFSDDGGSGDHSGDKNPQSAVEKNECHSNYEIGLSLVTKLANHDCEVALHSQKQKME